MFAWWVVGVIFCVFTTGGEVRGVRFRFGDVGVERGFIGMYVVLMIHGAYAGRYGPLFGVSFRAGLSVVRTGVEGRGFKRFPSFFEVNVGRSHDRCSLGVMFIVGLVGRVVVFIFTFRVQVAWSRVDFVLGCLIAGVT